MIYAYLQFFFQAQKANAQQTAEYGQLQPFPDPPLTPQFQEQPVSEFAPSTPEFQPPQDTDQIATEDAAQQAAAQEAVAQEAVDQQAAAQQVVTQQAAADAALQQATFQCDQTIMGRDFEYDR